MSRWIIPVCVSLMLAGCGSRTRVDGGAVNVSRQETVTAPTVTRETRQIVHPIADKQPVVETVTSVKTGGETRTVIASGTANGASAEATGDGKIAQDLQTGAPNLNLGEGVTGSGGEVDSTSQASAAPKTWGVWAVGLLVLLAAGGLLYIGQPKAAIIAGAIGIGLITAGFFPLLLLWVLLGAIALAVAAWFWSAKTGKSFKEAVRAVAAGIETLPDEAATLAKKAIASHADDSDKAVISRIKREDGL